MKKRISCLLIGVCCLLMFVACGTQSGANSNDNTENQNAEVDLLKKVEKANTDEALLAKYGKVAYRHVYTYGDGHSESSYRYLDADRYVVEDGPYIDIVEDGEIYGFDTYVVFRSVFVEDCFAEYAKQYPSVTNFQYSADIEKIESQEEKNDVLTVVTSTQDAAILTDWETNSGFEEGLVASVEFVYELDAKTYELIAMTTYVVKADGTKINVCESVRVDNPETYVVDEQISKIINSEDKRTLTVIAHPGTEQEKTYSASIGKGNGIIVCLPEDADKTLYLDAECTTVYEGGADLNADLTLYYK